MSDPLFAVSPLDGRYADLTQPLQPYASEWGLMSARVEVEVDYLLALADLDATPLELDEEERRRANVIVGGFDDEEAAVVKRLETEGYGDVPATNHDVKAVEYYLRLRLPEHAHPWIHFGLTSEDVNNLAYRLLVRGAVEEVLRPALEAVRAALAEAARDHRDVPMLARTHGQPASPTTFGKELAVFCARLDRWLDRLEAAVDDLAGKLAGASGTYAAHVAAYPEVDWPAFSRAFVERLDLEHLPLVTQVNPGDDLAALFDALRGANRVLLDLDRDAWRYVSDRYLVQRAEAGETGSSTMPHKVNPIDFENAEGNLEQANSALAFLADSITTSRLQRDLSDSTVKRNVGSALAHCLIGYEKTRTGLSKVAPDADRMRAALEANPAILAEAVQTVLRREGHADAYERVKAITRDREVTLASLRAALDDLDLDDDVAAELGALEPADYVGLAPDLVDEL